MSPRVYDMTKRREAVGETQARILTAARSLLTASDGFGAFSVPALARAAGVARVTVYNQFGSRAGLFEALSDDLARTANLGQQLGSVFAEQNPDEALTRFVAVFTRFWASDRLLIRRLRAVAVLDPDLEKGLAGRDERRRQGARIIVGRLSERHGTPGQPETDLAVDAVSSLTSFETFDALAGEHRDPEQVAIAVTRLIQAALRQD